MDINQKSRYAESGACCAAVVLRLATTGLEGKPSHNLIYYEKVKCPELLKFCVIDIS